MRVPASKYSDLNMPNGIQRCRSLPDDGLGALWDSIIIGVVNKSVEIS